MAMRSEVVFAIDGPSDRLEFLQRWAENLFALNEVEDPNDNGGLLDLDGQSMLVFECGSIKWHDFRPYWHTYPELREFDDIMRAVEKWGLNARFIEITEEGGMREENWGNGIDGLYATMSIRKPW